MSLAPGPLLEGKITVVTGAGEGSGQGIAVAFGAHGATVVIADHDSDQLAETADAIAAAGGKVIPVVADVTRRADVRRLAELAGEVEVLVNNVRAAPVVTLPFLESSEEEWETLYEANLKQVLLCCRAMVPGMIIRGRGGSVINMSASSQVLGAALGWGVARFTQSLAKEVEAHRIRVNAIRVRAGATGRVSDLAGVALFLASDLSSNVSGTSIPVGGNA